MVLATTLKTPLRTASCADVFPRQTMKRRLEDAGLLDLLSPHSFRVTVGTGLPLEDVHYLTSHASPTTMRVYIRRRCKINPQYRRADFYLDGCWNISSDSFIIGDGNNYCMTKAAATILACLEVDISGFAEIC